MTKKHPGGRPTKYDPAFCEEIVNCAKLGMSLAEAASQIGVCRKTIDNWAADHEEFLQALTRAKTEEQAWWENTGRQALFADKFQAAIWKKSMEARFRNDYTERKEVEHDATDRFGKFLAGIDGNSSPLVRD